MRHDQSFTPFPVLETAERLGQRIRSARKAQKLTLLQLEKNCRIHRTTLGRLERGEPGVSLGVFLTVLDSLQELSDVELILSQPDKPKHKRVVPPPVLKRDF